MRDAGSYRYNTTADLVRYFNGTQSHNTLMLGDNDQMLKGPRFIWWYWSKSLGAKLEDRGDHWYFSGTIQAFRQVHKNITHRRVVKQYKNRFLWEIEDTLQHSTDLPIHQYWQVHEELEKEGFKIEAWDGEGIALEKEIH